jgi:hypothetical protein
LNQIEEECQRITDDLLESCPVNSGLSLRDCQKPEQAKSGKALLVGEQ